MIHYFCNKYNVNCANFMDFFNNLVDLSMQQYYVTEILHSFIAMFLKKLYTHIYKEFKNEKQ